jgi:hypothetical protein
MRNPSRRSFLCSAAPAFVAATVIPEPVLPDPASPIISAWLRRPELIGVDHAALFDLDSAILEEFAATTLHELAIQARVAQLGDYCGVRSIRNMHFGRRQILAYAELHGVKP